MYKTVIFDLDGTLLDTLDDLMNAVNFALREFSFPERTREEIRSFIGNGVVKLMERSTPEGTDAVTQEKCLETFRKHYLVHMADNTAPYEGIIALLQRLKAMGIKTAVVSNKFHPAVVGLCEDYFPSLIDVPLGVAEEKERKPCPLNVYRAMEMLSSDKENTIYAGDSNVDVETAHNADLKCIGVTWGFRDREDLISHSCDYIADTADEVLKLIIE
ncbi:MAG: HAD hydrolase-like protein [Clostridia bacterium]|nr:HAD hydrolase-like protein [Clostridia bacterium]